MPHKHKAGRRHHIPKMELKVTNWAEYEAGLRWRGSQTMWVTTAALGRLGWQEISSYGRRAGRDQDGVQSRLRRESCRVDYLLAPTRSFM